MQIQPPSAKLPAFYLLDSIAKNIGPPYIILFSRFIEILFLTAYREVDSHTQFKMEELLGTWRTGGANGVELFNARNQKSIENQLFGRDGRGGGIGGGGKGMNDNRHFLSGVSTA